MAGNKKKFLPINWLLIVFILALYIIGYLLYPLLPDMMPTHWNLKGEVDGYSSKTYYVLFFPSLILALYLLISFAPKFDPRPESYEKFTGVVAVFRTLMVLIFAVIYLAPMALVLGYTVSIAKLIRFSIGILLVFIGNYFGKIRHNYTFGIKTPWTLASEEVWNKTHRTSGPLWVIAGIIWIVSIAIPDKTAFIINMVVLGIATFYGFIYSYILFKKIKY
jgi:uncharacterized membrane protein